MFKKIEKMNYLITDSKITVNYNGETHMVPRSDGKADELIELLKTKEYDKVPPLLSKKEQILKYSKGKFEVVDGKVHIEGLPVPELLSRKIIEFMDQDLPYMPLVNFARKLKNNPSNKSLNALYRFLEHNNHPITEDGNFVAYKKVKADFKDIYSGKFDNSPGTTVSVPRNQVDEDCNNTCSYGLHVANWDYAHNHYGVAYSNVVVEVEVDPADVVAVPEDYNNSKMRVCKYVVVDVVNNSHEEGTLLKPSLAVEEDDCDSDDDMDDDFDDDMDDDWGDDAYDDDDDDDVS